MCSSDLYFVGKKKKPVSLFYIYNFYFENLIYKWIKQFENQQESDYFFGNILVGVRVVCLPDCALVFLYLNVGV